MSSTYINVSNDFNSSSEDKASEPSESSSSEFVLEALYHPEAWALDDASQGSGDQIRSPQDNGESRVEGLNNIAFDSTIYYEDLMDLLNFPVLEDITFPSIAPIPQPREYHEPLLRLPLTESERRFIPSAIEDPAAGVALYQGFQDEQLDHLSGDSRSIPKWNHYPQNAGNALVLEPELDALPLLAGPLLQSTVPLQVHPPIILPRVPHMGFIGTRELNNTALIQKEISGSEIGEARLSQGNHNTYMLEHHATPFGVPNMPRFLFELPLRHTHHTASSKGVSAGSALPSLLSAQSSHASSSSGSTITSHRHPQPTELLQPQHTSSTPPERRPGGSMNDHHHRPAKRRKVSPPGVIQVILGTSASASVGPASSVPWVWTRNDATARLMCLYDDCAMTCHFEATSWEDMWSHLGLSNNSKSNKSKSKSDFTLTHGISRSKSKTGREGAKVRCGWPECGKMMSPCSLANHIDLSHLKAFAIECGYCKKSFTQGRSADDHTKKSLLCKARNMMMGEVQDDSYNVIG